MAKKKHLCQTVRCGNNKASKDKFCAKHRKRLQKEKNPVAYTFNLLKSNAKKRKKFFDLTLEQFKGFCEETGYMDLKGKTAESASIDRVVNTEGYTLSNLRLLTLSANTKKRNEEDYPF